MTKFKIIITVALLLIFSLKAAPVRAGEYGVIDALPLWGDKMRESGLTPPKPFFVAPLVFYMEDYMKITDVVATGRFHGISAPASVTMNNVSTNTVTGGVRAGFWPLPFLQIFGMYFYTDGYTKFDAQAAPVYAGTGPNKLPILPRGYRIKQKMNFTANTYAIGANAAYGIKLGPVHPFASLNGNFAWSTADILEGYVSTVVLSARLGTSVPLPKNMDISVWLGAMYKITLGMGDVKGTYTAHVSADDLKGGMLASTFPNGLDVESSYTAIQSPVSPWNMVAGLSFAPCRYFSIMTEFGFIGKFTTNVGLSFNF